MKLAQKPAHKSVCMRALFSGKGGEFFYKLNKAQGRQAGTQRLAHNRFAFQESKPCDAENQEPG